MHGRACVFEHVCVIVRERKRDTSFFNRRPTIVLSFRAALHQRVLRGKRERVCVRVHASVTERACVFERESSARESKLTTQDV